MTAPRRRPAGCSGPAGRSMSRELTPDRCRSGLGVHETVAAVSLAREPARIGTSLNALRRGSGEDRTARIADARCPREAPRSLGVDAACLLDQVVGGPQTSARSADPA